MKKLLALFITILFAGTASAQSTQQYYFADTVIEIFAEMRDSTRPPQRKENLEDVELIQSALENSIRKDRIYSGVQIRLKKFDKSKDKGIRFTARLLSTSVSLIHSANSEALNYLEKLLNDPKLMLQNGTVSREMAALAETSHSAFRTYATVSPVVTHALMDYPADLFPALDGSQSLKGVDMEKWRRSSSKLRLTKSEVDLLKEHLQRSFGSVISGENTVELVDFVDIPALSMFRFLNDKWIPAPEK